MTSGYKWKPLARATARPMTETHILALMKAFACDRETAIELGDSDDGEIWKNDLYQVLVRRLDGLVHLNIRRVDGYPGRDWRHFQQIKNELVGPECEAIELYPAESRLIDQGNKYHLWAVTDPAFRFPVGWNQRDVDYTDHVGVKGMRQRPPMQFDRRAT